MLETILLFIILFILIFLLLFIIKKEKVGSTELESVFYKIWKNSGIDEKIGQVSLQTKEIKDLHSFFEKMLTTPTQRGYFGEITLEKILSDQLPPEMFGIRKQLSFGKTPDAYINSTAGLICIDSKFPLENYKKMLETEEQKEKEDYKKQFINDMKGHLEKIKKDYIIPEKGTASFAFAYIPSESVWLFLIKEAYELLKEYSKAGVQVISPLTLVSKIEFIKAGVHSKKLSEEAEKVKINLQNLSRVFESLDYEWKTFSEKHLKSLVSKAEEIDKSYKKIREEFEKIKEFK